MTSRSLLVFLILIISGSCEKAQPCALLGCGNGLVVTLCGDLPPTFEITIREVISLPKERKPWIFEEIRTFTIDSSRTCEGVGLEDLFPETVSVGIFWEDDSLIVTTQPDYQVEYKNGPPPCEPCTLAWIDIVM